MNYIWSAMIITGIIFACINGQIPVFCDGLMQSCTDAVQFIISIAGVMALWTGLMNIADKIRPYSPYCKKTPAPDAIYISRRKKSENHRHDGYELHSKYLRRRKQRYGVFS